MNAYERRHELAPGARQTSTAWLCLSHDDGASFGKPWMHSVIQGPSDHLVSGGCFSDDNGRTWEALRYSKWL